MANKKELIEESVKATGDFFKLADLLLGGAEDAPYEINELKEDNEFYETAREISDEMKLDWDNMSHEDSNRVMLNLLGEYYARIQTSEDYQPILNITFKKK